MGRSRIGRVGIFRSRTPQRSSHENAHGCRALCRPVYRGRRARPGAARGLRARRPRAWCVGSVRATATGLVSMVDAPRAEGAAYFSRYLANPRRTVARVAALRNHRPDHRRVSVRPVGRPGSQRGRTRSWNVGYDAAGVSRLQAARPWASAPRSPADVPAVRH